MKIGDKVRYNLQFCLVTKPQWYLAKGTIIALDQNREYFVATVIWDRIENPAKTFTFNLEKI